MGNSSSGYTNESNELDKFDGVETLGYRVLGVQPNSPASQAGLVSFFDFLVGANNQMLLGSGDDLQEGDEYEDIDLPDMLHEFKGKPLELLVWNIKAQEKRLVLITPRDNWGGAGLLGVTIRLDNYGGADERLIRVLEMEPKVSPAAVAGSVPLQDYLLGTTTQSFEDTQVLADVLKENADRVVELYVYNTTSDVVRIVALMPTRSWGGKGLLGAEVGTGYLHRLPRGCRETGGTSVERKVRWTRHNKNNTDQAGGAQEAIAPLTSRPEDIRNEPTLEMEPEPQEHHDDGSDEAHHENVHHATIGEVSRSGSNGNDDCATDSHYMLGTPVPPEKTNIGLMEEVAPCIPPQAAAQPQAVNPFIPPNQSTPVPSNQQLHTTPPVIPEPSATNTTSNYYQPATQAATVPPNPTPPVYSTHYSGGPSSVEPEQQHRQQPHYQSPASAATTYAAPTHAHSATAASLFSSPPPQTAAASLFSGPVAPQQQTLAATNPALSGALSFMPPPPMSHLSTDGDIGAHEDLR